MLIFCINSLLKSLTEHFNFVLKFEIRHAATCFELSFCSYFYNSRHHFFPLLTYSLLLLWPTLFPAKFNFICLHSLLVLIHLTLLHLLPSFLSPRPLHSYLIFLYSFVQHRASSPSAHTRGPVFSPNQSDPASDNDTHTQLQNAIQLSCQIVAHSSSGIPSPGPPYRYGPSYDPAADTPECPSKIASQYCYNIEVVESVGGDEGDGQMDNSDSQVRTCNLQIPQGIGPQGYGGFLMRY